MGDEKVTRLSLCELFGIEFLRSIWHKPSEQQSSAIATSRRFRMAREALARAQPIKMREFSKLVARLLISRISFQERFLRSVSS